MGGGLLALEFTGILDQDVELGGTTPVDDRNGFNDLSRLGMLWKVRHRWPEGARFAFNCYRIGYSFSSASLVMHQSFS